MTELSYTLGDVLMAEYEADFITAIPSIQAEQYQINIQEDLYITVVSCGYNFFVAELVHIKEDGTKDVIDDETMEEDEDVYDFIEFWLDAYKENQE